LIEAAYTIGAQLGLAVWTEDEAGPFQTVPEPGGSWQPEGEPARQPHEYVRNGTAKVLTMFEPASGQVRVKGVSSVTNAVLHAWMKATVREILDDRAHAQGRAAWERWQEGLSEPITLPDDLPPLRMLLVMDNLTGHRSVELLLWLFAQGVMVLYTPLGGCWLNMAESIQRILKRRALSGQTPRTPEQIMAWFEQTARAWNRAPTPFVWGGKRAARRQRQRQRRQHHVGGSGAVTRSPIRRPRSRIQWPQPSQVTH
jgi:transposase